MSHAGPPYSFNVNEMLLLRSQGWSYPALGRRYGKDHTTILYHCQKNNVVPNVAPPKDLPVMKPEEKKPRVRPSYKYDKIKLKDTENYASKTYKQYLEEAKKRDKIYVFYDNLHKKERFTLVADDKEKKGTGHNTKNPRVVPPELPPELRLGNKGVFR